MVKNETTKLAELFRCPLCGFQFYFEESEKCHTCPLRKHCNLMIYPKCHYEFLSPHITIRNNKAEAS